MGTSSSRGCGGGPSRTEGSRPTGDLGMDTHGGEDRVLRKAETVLARRTGRFLVIIERCTADHNYSAIIRTAEALGVQHLWLIAPPATKGQGKRGGQAGLPQPPLL